MNEKGNILDLSVVIPVFNECEVIDELLGRLNLTLDILGIHSEILFIDDGSSDGTSVRILDLRGSYARRIRILKLQVNQGHMKALEIGMNAAEGKYVLTMDADLQDPPEFIENIWRKKMESNSEIVQAVRIDRSSDTFIKRFTAKLFYALAKTFLKIDVIPQAADFRLMDRKVVETICGMPDRNKIYRFLVPNLGFTICTIGFTRQKRSAGETKYTVRKMLSLATDSLFAFSSIPLRVVTNIGIGLSLFFIICTPLVFILHANFNLVPGWASLVTLYLAGNGITIFSIGIVGKYVKAIYDQQLIRTIKYQEL